MNPRPLAGIRVLDLTNVLAGPFCCQQLAHLGADVIKIEVPERGDLARQLGADAALSAQKMGTSFLAQNAGKRSITLNLKAAPAAGIFRKLAASADVLVENFRPGVMTRLGLDYESIKQINSTIIYCSISGFGQDGPLAQRPAYDQIIQGLAGIMSITGKPDDEPLRVGYPIADTVGGLTAAMAICASLHARPRGCSIDASILESALATMGWAVANYLIGAVEPQQLGNQNMTSAPSGAFRTQDGLINIAANEQEQWISLAHCLAREDLLSDARFATRDARKQNRSALTAELEKSLSAKTAAQWDEQLNAAGVPAGLVLTVPQALASAQIAQRGQVASYDPPAELDRQLKLLLPGFRMNSCYPQAAATPPTLGQHTEQVLSELGFSDEQISEFKRSKAI